MGYCITFDDHLVQVKTYRWEPNRTADNTMYRIRNNVIVKASKLYR
jgi:TPP-dependent pyruvate/acetoin dehydrogenase alpha subunit